MHKIITIAFMTFALAGCQTYQQQRVGTGALIGGATGAAIGGITGGSGSSALVGGLIGAAAGGVIGAATTPKKCYVRTPSGKLQRVRC